MDCSLPGSSVHAISQARVLEWVAVSFSRGSSQARDWTCVSWFLTTEPLGKPGCLVVWINSVPTEMKIEHLVNYQHSFLFFYFMCFFYSLCSASRKDTDKTYQLCWVCLISVQFSHSVESNSLRPHGLQDPRPPLPSATPRVYSNSCPLSQWCHPTISSSVVPYSSCLQSFPASGSFLMSQFFASGSQVLEFQPQQQSFQWIFRTDFL